MKSFAEQADVQPITLGSVAGVAGPNDTEAFHFATDPAVTDPQRGYQKCSFVVDATVVTQGAASGDSLSISLVATLTGGATEVVIPIERVYRQDAAGVIVLDKAPSGVYNPPTAGGAVRYTIEVASDRVADVTDSLGDVIRNLDQVLVRVEGTDAGDAFTVAANAGVAIAYVARDAGVGHVSADVSTP